MADQVEQGGRRQAGAFADHRAIAAPPAVPPIFQGLVGRPADAVLDEAVAGDPAGLFVVPELRPQGRREPVEQVEEGAGIAAGQRASEGQGGAAGVGQNTGGNPLRGAAALVLVDLVGDQQVEPARHTLLDVVGERIAAGAGAVGLPEGGPTVVAGTLAPRQLCVRQRHAVGVHHLRSTDRAARHTERFPRGLVPQQLPVAGGPTLDDGGLPAVGELGALAGEDGEQRAGAAGLAQAFQGGDGRDDGGAGGGDGRFDLALPLAGQVRWDEHQYPLKAGEVGGGGGDEGLAGAHLPDDGGTALGGERVGGAADGGFLRAQRAAQQRWEWPVVGRGAVLGWVGGDDALGDGLLVGIEKRAEVHLLLLSCREGVAYWGMTGRKNRRGPADAREGLARPRGMVGRCRVSRGEVGSGARRRCR